MKYLTAYLTTAAVVTGFLWLGYSMAQLVSIVFADNANFYLLWIGAVVGLAGPIRIYIEEGKKKEKT